MGAKKSKLNKEVLDELTVKTKFRNILFDKLSFLKLGKLVNNEREPSRITTLVQGLPKRLPKWKIIGNRIWHHLQTVLSPGWPELICTVCFWRFWREQGRYDWVWRIYHGAIRDIEVIDKKMKLNLKLGKHQGLPWRQTQMGLPTVWLGWGWLDYKVGDVGNCQR